MERVLTDYQMRVADAYTINIKGVPSEVLMRRAGEAIANEVLKVVDLYGYKKVLVVCGTGNNGGDGYVCAQKLLNSGIAVSVYAFDGNLSADCAREKANYNGEYSYEISGEIIVDCIFGTGLAREVSGKYKDVIQKINSLGAYVIAADIPSGLSSLNGCILGVAVKANLTVAIAEYKVGMTLGDGPDICGAVVRRDIGITCPDGNYMQIYSDGEIAKFFPERRRNSHKGTYGSANLIAGSDKYLGAAALSAEAALNSGCGLVKLTTSQKVNSALAVKLAQVIYLDDPDLSSQAIAVGMGCGVSEELYVTLKSLLKNFGGTLIIDADGLNSLAKHGVEILNDKICKVILTPHIKEFSRLTGLSVDKILSDPAGYAKEFAQKYDVTLILKSAASVICDGVNTVINVRGTTALAKGGSGDMLSGFLCGSVARGLCPFDAAVCAAYILGVAAEISSEQKTDYCATAKDILKNLPKAIKNLTT
ncbi:MAG: NAD(P)H-hydrate dehydratase [Clostridia bacterium]|nr:NAD(P)H-hydrate dehydratase [Clostridia bacterium]